MSREKLLSSPVYWFDVAQNELFRQFHDYMERENINRTQLAERLGITKGRVSQILRGESNFSMKTLIELGLSIGVIPNINYIPVKEIIRDDEIKRLNKQGIQSPVISFNSEKKSKVQFKHNQGSPKLQVVIGSKLLANIFQLDEASA